MNYTIWDLAKYFLWLGTFGFGGPIALIGYMQRDLVEKKGWLTHDDYVHGLALAQMCPGPLATYLALYFGWLKARVFGVTIIAISFLLPSFLLVIALAIFYTHNNDVSWVVGAFYGIGASIIAIIFRSACKLAKLTCRNETLLWILFGLSAILAPFVSTKVVFLLLTCGLIAMLIKAPPRIAGTHAVPFAWLTTGLHVEATGATLTKMALFFVWAGAFVFGSGLAIIPLLEPGVVQEYQWLTTSQFIDAVSVGLITPGPALITSAFIGFLVAGLAGALVAVIAVFLPCYFCVILLAPIYGRVRKNHSVRAFLSGISAAASGVILGAAFILGKQAIVDIPTVIICVISTLIIFLVKKIPEPVIILAAGIVGVILK